MKKILFVSLSALLVLSSCGTYTGAGAYTGAQFGSIIGSAIGGISGRWRGHDVGSLVGLAGGAAVGAAIGAAADRSHDERVNRRLEQMDNSRRSVGETTAYGDDRIDFDGTPPVSSLTASPSALKIENLQLVDTNQDGRLVRGEAARVIFEIRNTSSKPVYSVQPSVTEITGNKHIHISENILIECIQPYQAVRYTAQVKADDGLRNGESAIRVTVFQANHEVASQGRVLKIQTLKKAER